MPSTSHAPLPVIPPSFLVHTASQDVDTNVLPFKINGGGNAPQGLSLAGVISPHDATGIATHLGKYSGNEGAFQLLSFDPATLTGTFTGSFVFVAANGDRLAFKYGVETPGTFAVTPTSDGKVTVQFIAEFNPDLAESTGRFAKVTGGSFTMIANTEPFELTISGPEARTPSFNYTWTGEGSIEFGKKA